MTTWNYRMTRDRVPDGLGGQSDVFAIREVYYDADGKPTSWSKDPIAAGGETVQEAGDDLSLMGRALGRPVLDLTLDPPQFVDLRTFTRKP